MKILNYSKKFYKINVKKIGALTSKPYSFKGRPWELVKLEMIDFFDGLGSGIRVDTRGMEVLRILPQTSSFLNEDWITDKIRFGFDGLKYQRLLVPLKRVNNTFNKISWFEAFNLIKSWYIRGQTLFEGIAGSFCDVETLFGFKQFLALSGSNLYKFNDKFVNIFTDFSVNFLSNISVSKISTFDFILLVNCEPRLEAPLINLRLRKQVLKGLCKVYYFGGNSNTTFGLLNLGNSLEKFLLLLEGKHIISPRFYRARNPFVFLGNSLFQRKDSSSYCNLFLTFLKNIKSIQFGLLSPTASFVGGLWLNDQKKLNYGEQPSDKILYLVGADELIVNKSDYKAIIYQGHHGDRGAKYADLVLPVKSLFEKTSRFYNLEGTLQFSKYIFTTNNNSLVDWKLFKLLATHLGFDLYFYENFYQILSFYCPSRIQSFGFFFPSSKYVFTKTIWKKYIKNYYNEDVICRASPTLALQSVLFDAKNFNI